MKQGRNAPCSCGSGRKSKLCCGRGNLGASATTKPYVNEDALIICVPTRGSVSHETLLTIEQNIGEIRTAVLRVARKPVVEARNTLAEAALDVANGFPFTPRETFILWLDDDAWLPPGAALQMMQCLREPWMQGIDALFAWFCGRVPFAPPVAYRRMGDLNSVPKINVDCRPGEIVPIEAAGFHCVMMRTGLLSALGPNPFSVDPSLPEGEDMAFCRRANAIGERLAVATQIPAAHIDPRDGLAYLPGMPAMMFAGNGLRHITTEHNDASGAAKAPEVRGYGLQHVESMAAAQSAQYQHDVEAEIARRRES